MSIFDINNLKANKDTVSDKPLVMLVDDEIENLNVLRQLLESKFQVITGLNGREAIELIENMKDPKKIQLIISDQRMPELTGVEFLEIVASKMPETIRIILTGYSDTQVIIDSINKAQLYKFMTKPFEPTELLLTVQRGIEAYQMRQELMEYTTKLEEIVAKRTKELHQKNEELSVALANLEKLSLTDQLTGIHNRHFFCEAIPTEIAKINREHFSNQASQSCLGFLMLDIDHFKQVNDSYGHDAGDKVLAQFSKILTDSCRESDWAIRWGGEEFVVVVRDLAKPDLEAFAQRINENVEAHQFDLGDGKLISKTCSIGIACYPFIANQSKLITWEQTLHFADLALYIAKKNGRNTWVHLFENDIVEYDNLFQDLTANLKELISSGGVSINSPLSHKSLSI